MTSSYKTLNLSRQKSNNAVAAHIELQWQNSSQPNLDEISELITLMHELEDEPDCTLIVFSGLDIQENHTKSPPVFEQISKWEGLIRKIEVFCGVTIAAMNGHTSLYPLQLVLACDYRLATQETIFDFPELAEGYLPGMGIFRLAKYVGVGVARRLLLTGNTLPADQAMSLGLIDQLCEQQTFAETIMEAQTTLMPKYPETVRSARRLLNESYSATYEDAIGHVLAAQNLCLSGSSKLSDKAS